MKKLLLLMLLLVTVFQGYSQTKGISYQAVILSPKAQEIPGSNAQGNILSNSAVSIQFIIVNASGTEEYQEQHNTRTDRYGMINLLIGTGTSTSSNDFTAIFWDGTTKKLKVGIDFSAGSNFSPLSEQNLTYMPQPPTEEVTIEIESNSVAILEEQTRAMQAELGNTTDISVLKTEQSIQNTAIALNTTKVSYPGDQDLSGLATITSVTSGLALKVDEVAGQRLINAAEITNLGNQSGTNTGDQDLSGLATSITTGLASKVDKVAGERLINSTEITKLGNQSGTNSGDQDISGIVTNAIDILTLESEQTTQNTAIALNTVKVSYPGDQDLSGLATTTSLTSGLAGKVDKVLGERLIKANEIINLSNQSGTNTGDQNLSGLVTTTSLTTGLAGKVDKVTGERLINAAEITNLSNQSGTNSGDQDLSSYATKDMANTSITNLSNPVNDQDAATKAYVDALEAKLTALEVRIIALEPQPAVIGDLREGGIVFWVDPADNTHGLVCAIEDQSTGIRWYNGSNIATGAIATGVGTGSANTDAIIAVQGATETSYAAGLAKAYNGGGYTDWFLPSKDELHLMSLNRVAINATASVNGGSNFSSNYYWSSSEKSADFTWFQNIYNETHSHNVKYDLHSMRAVRAF